MSVESAAISAAISYYEREGWQVQDVSHTRGGHAGFDLLVHRGAEQLKIEVKGTEKPYYGIPDLFSSEVDSEVCLVADVLFVVYMPIGQPLMVAPIPKADLPYQAIVPKAGFRIRSAWKNAKFISQYLKAIP